MGWRRKVGVCTLMLACLLMAGWVRSYSRIDLATHESDLLCSSKGGLHWYRSYHPNFSDGGFATVVGTLPNTDEIFLTDLEKVLEPQWFGFGVNTYPKNGVVRSRRLVIPYWSLVVPLTLVSGFLWLTKPRQATQRKSAIPIPNESGKALSEMEVLWAIDDLKSGAATDKLKQIDLSQDYLEAAGQVARRRAAVAAQRLSLILKE